MFKRIILVVLTLGLCSNLVAVIEYPKNVTAVDIQKNPNKEIAWDIHNVLAQKEPSALGKKFASFKNYTFAFAQAPTSVVSSLYNWVYAKITGKPNPVTLALRDMKNIPKSADASGEVYATIFEKHNLPGMAKITEYASSAYRPQPGMSEIVTAINNDHIPQRFASNIGPRFLATLKQKFAQYKADWFNLIQPGKIVDYSKYGREPLANPTSDLSSVGKPDPLFFQDYIRTYNPDRKKVIVFVDDKPQNVQAAVNEGMVGIVYTDIPALKTDLNTLGIAIQ